MFGHGDDCPGEMHTEMKYGLLELVVEDQLPKGAPYPFAQSAKEECLS